ncbi:transforming growth factor beta receptor type 3-like [Hemicordylus capensis]|uniref:transforming growth factor beta receptor type 3-like n=1 Tax=Hemicordylus capensis TaxID=884348 RepID=UPI00230323B1|nr:transforming growth factor beta receptor type 3-like [Hemicordylus capensis]
MHGNGLQTDCLWKPYMLLLALWECPGKAAWQPPTCLPLSPSTPHSVLGFWEVLRRGTGCASRGSSASGQEVHVVSLQGKAPANAQVTLVLGPDAFDKAPIFVLRSQEPLRWMLPSPPGKNWTFQVSPGSSVSALGPEASAEISFPETPRGLLKWVRRKHGGVTSLAEYHGVNTIYTRLGADGTAPATCRLRPDFLTPRHFASERRLQPLQTCLNPDPPQDLEVHIILSKGAAPSVLSSRPSLARLTVELHAVRRSPRWGLLLILKSEGAAQWMVHAHHLTGQLHVLASHKVVVRSTEMDLPLTVTQHTSPGLAYARDPVQWAAEQNLPAFTSYTEAERVNRFLLLIGMNEATPTPPEDPKPFGPMFLLPHRLAESPQHFPEAFSVGWGLRQEFLAEDSSAAHPLPTAKAGTERTEATLCLGEQKPLHENKDAQRVFCVSPPSTQTSPLEATMALQDPPFHLGKVLLNLEVYSSEAFVKQPGPCTVSANSRVFVEASLAVYDLCLGFTIRQCFISPSSDFSVASPYLLVQHGCAADAHITLTGPEQATQGQALPPGYQERQRLSFVLQPRSNDSIHFLHCRLALCSRELLDPSKPRGPIPQCQSKTEACEDRGEEELASGRFQRMFTKPIIVMMETPPRATTSGLGPDISPANHQGNVLKDATHSRKAQPAPIVVLPAIETEGNPPPPLVSPSLQLLLPRAWSSRQSLASPSPPSSSASPSPVDSGSFIPRQVLKKELFQIPSQLPQPQLQLALFMAPCPKTSALNTEFSGRYLHSFKSLFQCLSWLKQYLSALDNHTLFQLEL